MSIERQGQSRREKTKMKQEHKDRSKGEMLSASWEVPQQPDQ